ncbi:hypothetical protein Pst134EB_002019 [Puccinia striiformis f. sp. tritici]|nr:hypothetical protein Pst134EB_002019 [Puccinia striiformis f. sp. tritici]
MSRPHINKEIKHVIMNIKQIVKFIITLGSGQLETNVKFKLFLILESNFQL